MAERPSTLETGNIGGHTSPKPGARPTLLGGENPQKALIRKGTVNHVIWLTWLPVWVLTSGVVVGYPRLDDHILRWITWYLSWLSSEATAVRRMGKQARVSQEAAPVRGERTFV